MGTKMAVAFANIFMADIETEILSKSVIKPLIWKRYIDDIFSLWDVSKQDIDKFITQANSHHPTIKPGGGGIPYETDGDSRRKF